MKINDSLSFRINKTCLVDIEDSSKIDSLRVKIEASHAGVINDNDIMYTGRALKQGAETLLNPYAKVLQRKHYSKAVGPIQNSYYIEDTSSENKKYINAIESATSAEDLVAAVNNYTTSSSYKNNKNKGLGALYIEGTIYSKDKILELRDNSAGHVSIAGDSSRAFCSICAKAAGTCMHQRGKTYNKRKAFVIADSAILDHVSFEEYPADIETQTIILQDASTTSVLEVINYNNTEGQTMKITLDELKAKLKDLSALSTQLKLKTQLQFEDSDNSSDYLFIEDKLLPLTTKDAVYTARELFKELEESEEKEFLFEKIDVAFKTLLGDQLEEDFIKELLVSEVQEVQNVDTTEIPAVVETIEQVDFAAIATQLSTQLDELKSTLLTSIQDSKVSAKSNILKTEVDALRADLKVKTKLVNQLTDELKAAILDKVSVSIADESVRESFLLKVADKSLGELQTAVALLDSLQVKDVPDVVKEVPAVEEEPALAIIDSSTASDEMGENLEIKDEFEILDKLVKDSVTEGATQMTKKQFGDAYRKVANTHGLKVAKDFATKLKTQLIILN